MSQRMLERARDLLPKYMWMGNWCSKKIEKGTRGKSERTKRPKIYVAIPPKTGWIGGRPEDNGLRGRSGK